MRLYYAQNKEDLFIKAFFPDVQDGFYIDVGANDPVLDSVTKLLYDEGWHGINVEPIKKHYEALKRSRPRDITVHCGLGSKPGTATFSEYPDGDGLSTFDTSMQDFYAQGQHPFPTKKRRQYEVEVKTLRQLVDEVNPKHVHFIKIDVEGFEFEVIDGYDWKGVRPELICIEANHIHNDWRPILRRNKYQEVFFDGVNNYYLAEESMFRKDYFDYPQTVFAGNPIYQPAFAEIESHVGDRHRQAIADKEQEITFLHQQQRDVRFLAKRLAVETQARLNRRAKSVVVSEHLRYRTDNAVNALTKGNNKDEVLAAVHRLDGQNIYRGKVTIRDRLKPAGWKVAAGTLNSGVRVAKRLRRGR